LFDPMPQPTKSAEWQIDPLIRSVDPATLSYATVDWARVPTVDYTRTRFRQLAKPESAKVFDDSTGFVLETFGAKSTPLVVEEVPLEAQSEADVDPAQENDATQDAVELKTEITELAPDEGVDAAEPMAEAEDASEDSTPEAEETFEASAEAVADDLSAEPETPVIDEALLTQLKEEAFAQGKAQGLEEGLAQGRAQAEAQAQESLKQAQTDAQAELERALAEQRETLEARLQPELELLREMTQRLEALTENPRQFFEPLKRLSLHLAEQLVLGELTISGAAIERLVQRCLDELDLHGKSMVMVELNPQDKARIGEKAAELLTGIQLQSVSSLAPGSVRVLVNDTQVEDLIVHRLEALAHGLLNQPEVWREQSPFFRQPLAQRDTEVEDVTQRPVIAHDSDEEPLDG
jgi:flagellar biosynthesis/type III secretory pathway protein FliH